MSLGTDFRAFLSKFRLLFVNLLPELAVTTFRIDNLVRFISLCNSDNNLSGSNLMLEIRGLYPTEHPEGAGRIATPSNGCAEAEPRSNRYAKNVCIFSVK